jgi:hypothetical protein
MVDALTDALWPGMESASSLPMAASPTLISATMNGIAPDSHHGMKEADPSTARYLGIQLTKDNNITTGKIYQRVLVCSPGASRVRNGKDADSRIQSKERKGDYLGRTVQVVPHITNEIQDWIMRVAAIPVDASGEEPDVCISEFWLCALFVWKVC